jgi:hypothetical protein
MAAAYKSLFIDDRSPNFCNRLALVVEGPGTFAIALLFPTSMPLPVEQGHIRYMHGRATHAILDKWIQTTAQLEGWEALVKESSCWASGC